MMNGYNDILDGGDYDHSSASTAYDPCFRSEWERARVKVVLQA